MLTEATWMNDAAEIPQYSKVKILTDRFRVSDGVDSGTVGYVIEVHHDASGPAYEIEVTEADGRTHALVVARASELEIME
jgi:hypothetical protein